MDGCLYAYTQGAWDGLVRSRLATLDPLLQDAGSAATEMRIAARRGRDADLAAATDDLTEAADHLDSFAQEHGP